MRDSPSVVVFKLVSDRLQHGGLAVARSLGRLGVEVHVAYRDRRSAAARSRFVSRRFHIPGGDERAVLIRLGAVAQNAAVPPILLPLDDVAAAFVDRHAPNLCAQFLFPPQPNGLSIRLANKRRLHELCVSAGIPVPDARFPRTRTEFMAMADELSFPVVVKSIDPALLRARPAASSVAIAHNRLEAIRIYDESEVPDQPNLMLQQFIPGGPLSVWMFNGYVTTDGSCSFGMTGQKIRQAPPDTGATSLGVAATNAVVAEHARRFLASVNYRGIVDMGFRYDQRDGSYRLLDVNPRIGSSFRLFADEAGNDVVRAMYRDLSGRRTVMAPVSGSRRWLVENQDLVTALKLMRQGRLKPVEWLRSLKGVEELAWWAHDDRGPFAAMLLGTASEAWRGLTRPRTARDR